MHLWAASMRVGLRHDPWRAGDGRTRRRGEGYDVSEGLCGGKIVGEGCQGCRLHGKVYFVQVFLATPNCVVVSWILS